MALSLTLVISDIWQKGYCQSIEIPFDTPEIQQEVI